LPVDEREQPSLEARDVEAFCRRTQPLGRELVRNGPLHRLGGRLPGLLAEEESGLAVDDRLERSAAREARAAVRLPVPRRAGGRSPPCPGRSPQPPAPSGIALGAIGIVFKRGNNIVGFVALALGFAAGAFFRSRCSQAGSNGSASSCRPATSEVSTIFSNGRVLVTGAFKATLTNLDDPAKSIRVNIPGPGTFTTTADGGSLLIASGPWLLFFSPGQLGPGTLGQMILTTGLFTLLTNPDGSQVFTHTTGTTTDVCTLVA
jgi:hypothetical protein